MSGLSCNIEDIIKEADITEFGVGFGDPDQHFYVVPIDGSVQSALRDMISDTWKAMQKCTKTPDRYEPSEKYSDLVHIWLPTNDDMVEELRNLHEAKNLPGGTNVLRRKFNGVSCYFARITDRSGRRLTAVRRATQFKGVLKSKLIWLFSDCMQLVEDTVFKLDKDFDLLIDSERIHILRPSGLENICRLKAKILGSVPKNIETIRKDLSFVDFETIKKYAKEHVRCARSLAAICSQGYTKNIGKDALANQCKNTGVKIITDSNGKIFVDDENVVGFLEVLDRRRYTTELKQGKMERFTAHGRRKINS